MLYFDASALVKRYLREPGCDDVNRLFLRGDPLFSSVLSYAEVLAVLGRKLHSRDLLRPGFERARDEFVWDYVKTINVLELDTGTLAAVPALIEQYPIRGGDVVHLSAVLWLRDMIRLVPSLAQRGEPLDFVTGDKRLAKFAREERLSVLTL